VNGTTGMTLRSPPRVNATPWHRATGNPILSASAAWEASGTVVQEPSVIYDSGTWKMWYTGGFNSPALGYASCTGDPTVAGNWTKYVSNPILGQGTVVAGWVSGNNILKVGSTYYVFYYDASGGGNLKVSTSADGIAWATPTTAIEKGAVAWIPGGWANSFVWGSSGAWKMLVEGSATVGGGPPWRISYATSSNSTPDSGWTVQGTNFLTSLVVDNGGASGVPCLYNGGALINGRYQLWFHAGNGNYTNIYHAYSTDAQNWTVTSRPELAQNGSTYETQQVADPEIIEHDNGDGTTTSYLFYDGINNGAPTGYINVATYPSTLANLVLWET